MTFCKGFLQCLVLSEKQQCAVAYTEAFFMGGLKREKEWELLKLKKEIKHIP